MSLEDAVTWVEKLSGMDSADNIGEFLRTEGITGSTNSRLHCVVAEFIREKTGVHAVVTAPLVTVWETQDGVFLTGTQSTLRPSHNLTHFITMFDLGRYPELISKEKS